MVWWILWSLGRTKWRFRIVVWIKLMGISRELCFLEMEGLKDCVSSLEEVVRLWELISVFLSPRVFSEVKRIKILKENQHRGLNIPKWFPFYDPTLVVLVSITELLHVESNPKLGSLDWVMQKLAPLMINESNPLHLIIKVLSIQSTCESWETIHDYQ